MTDESPSDRQQQWELVVRRSFGISDLVAKRDAREALIRNFEDQLHENGWHIPSRGTAEPIVDALMALGAIEDLDDPTLTTRTTRDSAYRLIEKGLAVIDPEHLVFDMSFEYPREVVAAAEQVLDRVGRYVREQQFGD
jgi:hypothetical protein